MLLLASCAAPQAEPVVEEQIQVEQGVSEHAPAEHETVEETVVQIEKEIQETEEIIEEEPEIEEAVEEVSQVISPSGNTPQTLKTGIFKTVKYNTNGAVHVDKLPEGNIVVNFIGFDTTPGAGLYVYLYKDDIKQGVELGKLTSVSGNYPYEVPEDVNIYSFDKVAIYSTSSEEIYGEAKLS